MDKRYGWLIAGLSVGLVAQVSGIVGVAWVQNNTQLIADNNRVANYTADDIVRGHIERAGMSDEGEFLYLASRPRVEGTTQFDKECGATEPGSGILGCYIPATQRIYLFDVTDERVDGTEDVVAAHEMLHAAWDRMPQSEQTRLSALLEVAYSKHKDNKELVERMALYKQLEPNSRTTELYSILGTEFSDLGPELEASYATYLTDRTTVTTLHTKANAVLVKVEKQSDALVKKMKSLRKSITSGQKSFSSKLGPFNADISDFNLRANIPGAFPSQAAFDAERGQLIDRQQALKKLQKKVNGQVTTYNKTLKKLQKLDATTAELYSAMNVNLGDLPDL